MGSKRLEQFQAAIKRLTDAREAGSVAEIASAQALLNVPLPSDLTPQQILEAGKQRLSDFEQVLNGQEGVTNWIKAATAGIHIAITNMEQPDRLAIPPEKIDAEIDAALGIAAQTAKLFIDPTTGAVIRGEMVGAIRPRESGTRIIDSLAGAEQPLDQNKLTEAVFGKKTDKPPAHVRSLVAKVNSSAETAGLPPVVERVDGGGYLLGPNYQVIGVEKLAPVPVVAPLVSAPAEIRPETLTISRVLDMEGVKGKMTETRLRHLAQELVASGHLRVGEHVAERHEGGKNYLDYTPAGIAVLAGIAKEFGDQGKIYVEKVREWLDFQGKVEPPAADSGIRYWGAQIAEAAGIPKTVLDTLQDVGAFQQGIHFTVEDRGEKKLRVYTPEALEIAEKVGKFAKKEGQDRFTEKLIRAAVGIPKTPAERPFGENGPAKFSDAIECRLLRTVKYCLPAIRDRVGNSNFLAGQEELLESRLAKLMDTVGVQRDHAVLELEKQHSGEDERDKVLAEQARAETMLAAATAFDLTQDRRKFNFLLGDHPGLVVIGRLIDELKQTLPILLEEFPHAVVELPTPIVQTTTDRSVNGRSILVGNLGHRRK